MKYIDILEELRALHATGVMGISREELLARGMLYICSRHRQSRNVLFFVTVVKERAGARERTPRRMVSDYAVVADRVDADTDDRSVAVPSPLSLGS